MVHAKFVSVLTPDRSLVGRSFPILLHRAAAHDEAAQMETIVGGDEKMKATLEASVDKGTPHAATLPRTVDEARMGPST